MHQGYDLVQHQSQRLVMTQTLQQAIMLLQMSSVELREFIQEAVTDNPLLEWPITGKRTSVTKRSSGVGRIHDAALQAVNQGTDLHSMLHEQLGLLTIPPWLVAAVSYLIDNLDERGYLTITLEEMAQARGMTLESVTNALAVLHSLEPSGIGARSLQECLQLQMQTKHHHLQADTPALYHLTIAIIQNGLEALGAGQYLKLQTRFKCSRADLELAIHLIRTLYPHPGTAFSHEVVAYVVPDLAVLKTEGRYVVLMYDHAFPNLRFNEYYRQLAKAELSTEEKEFFVKKTTHALNLLRSIEARRRTVYRVAEAITEYQQDFFEFGSQRLKPLTMKRMADELHLHESTISRAVAGKYADTPQGVMELKAFFSTALSSAMGDDVSAASVQSTIVSWIAKENPQSPLTDQELADRFMRDGIKVSRRTIAKYREELRIPSSAVRKRKFMVDI